MTKLCRVIHYLKRDTQNFIKPEGKTGVNLVLWWVDALCKLRQYFKIHAGGVISMGKGAVMENPKKTN